jgi:murein DD-endopeptidase MepM/ murein hydrolase activator NlpD
MGYLEKYPNTPFFKQRGIANKPHLGVDLAPLDKEGEDIYIVAPVSGQVIRVDKHAQYGWQVRIKSKESDKDFIHILAHLKQKPMVQFGQIVNKGVLLGIMGSTGLSTATHLHYEVRKGGTLERVNPKIYLT